MKERKEAPIIGIKVERRERRRRRREDDVQKRRKAVRTRKEDP